MRVCVLSMRLALVGALSAAIGALAATGASAESSQDSCVLEPARLPDAVINSFKENPSNLIPKNPAGGPPLSTDVRRLAASDVRVVPKLIDLAKDAKPEHIVALGIGLAQAAAICAKTKQEHAEAIKKLITESRNSALTASFSAQSSLFAFSPDGPDAECVQLGMGEPPDGTAPQLGDEEQSVTRASDSDEPDTAEKLGIGQSGFLYPFTFGAEPVTAERRLLPRVFGGGGLVATTGNVVSPTR